MNGAIIYQPGMLATLHTLRNEAWKAGNQKLFYALNVAVTEWISSGDSYNDLRRQAIALYRDVAKLDGQPT